MKSTGRISLETKRLIIEVVASGKLTVAQAASRFGVPEGVVNRWTAGDGPESQVIEPGGRNVVPRTPAPTESKENKGTHPGSSKRIDKTKSASRLFVLLLIILVIGGGIWFFSTSNNHVFSSKFDSMVKKAEERLAGENLSMYIEFVGGSNFYNFMDNHLLVTGNQNYFIEKMVALTADEGRTLTSSEVNADFEMLMRTVRETGGSGDEACSVIKSRLNTGIIEPIKIADDDVKCLYAAAVDMSLDFSDIDLLESNIHELEQRSGMPYGRVADAITRFEEYRRSEQLEILDTIGAIASGYR